MYLVRADDIQLTVGKKILLSHVSFTVHEGEHIAVVGKNGTGKTTLLKTIAAKAAPRKGEIDIHSSVWYVPQDIVLSQEERDLPVISYALTKHEDGWNVFHIVEELFDYHRITPEAPLSSLSGGELTMLHLALGFLIEPQLLLLDEPTNHLDALGTDRLIKKLKAFRNAYIVVSHDSIFMAEVADKILSIKEQKLVKFSGTYLEFIEQEKHTIELLEKQVREYQKEVTEAKQWKQKVSERIMRRESEQKKYRAEKVPRIIQGYFADRAGKSTTHDMALARKDERANNDKLKEVQVQLKKSQTLNIELGAGNVTVFSLADMHHAQLFLTPPITDKEKKLQQDLTIRVTNQDKVLITGRNGVGKSSFFKALLKTPGYELRSESKIIYPQHTVYIDQFYSVIKPEKTLMQHVAELSDEASHEDLRKILGNFLFTTDNVVNQLAGSLSGGEKARLALAMASMRSRNLLLLDEPTNNLDTLSIAELIVALNAYSGGIMIISHDKGFLSQLTITQQLAFE
jgi:ATPase subunit of ABC transporter with duplicated ATPase domains